MVETQPQQEKENVHDVYEQIASHFSSTRYKPWPVIEKFLLHLPDGACGLDVGAGNGKYLVVNPKVFIVASDRSINLTKIARRGGKYEAVVADGLDLPHPHSRFDFAICVAVVHHFSTAERRQAAIRSIFECLVDGGQCMIFVWALEQNKSRRGWDVGDKQDVMVPWKTLQKNEDGEESTQTYLRYYHLYREGELQHDVAAAGGRVVESGYDRDNWWVLAARN